MGRTATKSDRVGKRDAVDRWIRMVATNRLTGHSPGFFRSIRCPRTRPSRSSGSGAHALDNCHDKQERRSNDELRRVSTDKTFGVRNGSDTGITFTTPLCVTVLTSTYYGEDRAGCL